MTRRVLSTIALSALATVAPLAAICASCAEPAPADGDHAALAEPCAQVSVADVTPIRVAPPTLRETGLYADWDTRTIAPGVLAFSPQYPLWTDGAAKRRYLALPPGTWIDARDPEAWRFPVGTRLWKEFSFGRRVETRYMELGPEGWTYATYLWSDDEREAVLADARGGDSSVEIAPGVRHAIPSASDCVACHGNGETPVLGFALLQLSPDRDPLAPHADAPRSGDVDLRVLVERGLVRGLPAPMLDHPPRIAARTPIERAALGYLHGNCGACHRDTGPLAALGMHLAHVEGAAIEPAIATTVEVPSSFLLPRDPDAPARRVVPGDPGSSVLVARMSARDPITQMPPLGTHVVDEDAVRLVSAWIAELPVQPAPREGEMP